MVLIIAASVVALVSFALLIAPSRYELAAVIQ
jgi:hypothetical protein